MGDRVNESGKTEAAAFGNSNAVRLYFIPSSSSLNRRFVFDSSLLIIRSFLLIRRYRVIVILLSFFFLQLMETREYSN